MMPDHDQNFGSRRLYETNEGNLAFLFEPHPRDTMIDCEMIGETDQAWYVLITLTWLVIKTMLDQGKT